MLHILERPHHNDNRFLHSPTLLLYSSRLLFSFSGVKDEPVQILQISKCTPHKWSEPGSFTHLVTLLHIHIHRHCTSHRKKWPPHIVIQPISLHRLSALPTQRWCLLTDTIKQARSRQVNGWVPSTCWLYPGGVVTLRHHSCHTFPTPTYVLIRLGGGTPHRDCHISLLYQSPFPTASSLEISYGTVYKSL